MLAVCESSPRRSPTHSSYTHSSYTYSSSSSHGERKLIKQKLLSKIVELERDMRRYSRRGGMFELDANKNSTAQRNVTAWQHHRKPRKHQSREDEAVEKRGRQQQQQQEEEEENNSMKKNKKARRSSSSIMRSRELASQYKQRSETTSIWWWWATRDDPHFQPEVESNHLHQHHRHHQQNKLRTTSKTSGDGEARDGEGEREAHGNTNRKTLRRTNNQQNAWQRCRQHEDASIAKMHSDHRLQRRTPQLLHFHKDGTPMAPSRTHSAVQPHHHPSHSSASPHLLLSNHISHQHHCQHAPLKMTMTMTMMLPKNSLTANEEDSGAGSSDTYRMDRSHLPEAASLAAVEVDEEPPSHSPPAPLLPPTPTPLPSPSPPQPPPPPSSSHLHPHGGNSWWQQNEAGVEQLAGQSHSSTTNPMGIAAFGSHHSTADEISLKLLHNGGIRLNLQQQQQHHQPITDECAAPIAQIPSLTANDACPASSSPPPNFYLPFQNSDHLF